MHLSLVVAEGMNRGESCPNPLYLLFVKKYLSPVQAGRCGLGEGTEAIKGSGRKEEQVPLTSISLTFSQLTFYT